MFKGLFKKTKYITVSTQNLNTSVNDKEEQKPNIPGGMWEKCEKCGQIIYINDLKENNKVCNFCKYHFKMPAYERIESILDEGSFQELNKAIKTLNPLDFRGYEEKVESSKNATGLDEAVVTGIGSINEERVVICVMDSRFLMASMGSVVGEKITRAIEFATKEGLPLIIFTASGGARMQEGMFSLMQMAKVNSALARFKEKGLLYISVITNPTTGGVTASFAMVADIVIAEPGALIGFAGKRVIEQTVNEKLPEGFQTAEFMLKRGFIDKIVHRKNLRNALEYLVKVHKDDHIKNINNIENNGDGKENAEEYNQLTAWEKLNLVRRPNRPTALHYIDNIFDNFVEMHGDRYFGDDGCIIGGIATINGMPFTVIAQQKGRDLKENIKRNFGMPNPEGYRKALRLMKQAEKFKRPIICFVDTPGAYPGIGAEERGQGEAIGSSILEMSQIKSPIISIVIGEGGSGGALALSVADEVWMLENAIYSILTPEGFASILWKDSSRAQEASEIMKITAQNLKEFKIIDKILKEPSGDASTDVERLSDELKINLISKINELSLLSNEELLQKRYDKFRNMGVYSEF